MSESARAGKSASIRKVPRMGQERTASLGLEDVGFDDVCYSGPARAGKFIYGHRIIFLLPFLLPPLFLLNNPNPLPLWVRLASYALGLSGIALRLYCTGFRTWAHKSSGQRHLMTAGPYALVRHPLYAANLLIFLPLFIASGVWWLTAVFAAWFIVTHWLIMTREDEVLSARYGAEWEDYARKVRRWIPRLSRFSPRRGEFSFEPVLKGREPLHLALWTAFFLCLELFRPEISALLDSLQDSIGIYPWS